MSKAEIILSAADKTAGAFTSVKQRMASLAGEAENLSARFLGIGAAVGGVLVGGNFLRGIVDGIDRLNDLKDATGASIGNISALEDIAARAGTQFEVVSTSLLKLNQALLNAKPGDATTNTLQAIGLQAQELRRIDPAEALLRVARGLEQFADDGNKARATQVLFGRSLGDVAPLLKDLVETGQLNATVTNEQAQQAEAFNKQLARVSKNATDAGRAIAGPLLSSFNALADALGRASANPKGVLAGIGEQFEVDFLRARLQATQDDIERLSASAVRAREILSKQPDSIRAKATLAEFAEAEKQAQEYRTRIDAILYGQGGRRPANEGGGRLAGGARPTIGDIVGAASKPPSTQEGKGDLGAFIGQQLQRQNERDLGALQGLIDSTAGARSDRVVSLVQKASQLYADGALSLEDFTRAAEAGGRELEALAPKTEKVAEAVSNFSEQASRNIQDALGTSLVAALDGNFKSIEKLWANTIKQLVAQALAADLNERLFGKTFGQKGGKLEGIVGNLLTGGLSSIGNFFGGARAMGGPVQAGRAYLVGEVGPELIVPGSSGTVIPNNALGGSSVTVNLVQHIGQGVSRGEVYAAGMQAKDAAVAEIKQYLRRDLRLV